MTTQHEEQLEAQNDCVCATCLQEEELSPEKNERHNLKLNSSEQNTNQ